MSGHQLIRMMENIAKVHPEFLDAEIWSYGNDDKFHVELVGYDMKHKPPRIKLHPK